MSKELYFNPMTYEEYKEDKILRGCDYECVDEAEGSLFYRFKKSHKIKKIDFDFDSCPLKAFEWDACICIIERDEHGHVITKYPIEYFKLEKKFKEIHLVDLIQILAKQEMVYISEKENSTSYESKYDRVVDIPEKYYNYKVLAVSQSSNGTYYIMIEKGE